MLQGVEYPVFARGAFNDTEYYEAYWVKRTPLCTDYERARVDVTLRLVPNDVASVLDVGSGNALIIAELLKRRSLRVVALDRSFNALRSAPTEVNPLVATAEALPFCSRAFDMVLCCEVLEHLPFGIYEKALEELQRVAARYILITVPNAENRKYSFIKCPYCGCVFSRNRHIRSFKVDDLRNLLSAFTCLDVTPIGPNKCYYPPYVVWLADKLKIKKRTIPGTPVCPQCGFKYGNSIQEAPHNSPSDSPVLRRFGRIIFSMVKAFVPRLMKRPWLAALYSRR